jgi:hypothetical protein
MNPDLPKSQDARMVLIVIWAAMLFVAGTDYYVTRAVQPRNPNPESPLIYPLLGLAVLATLSSFYFKTRFGRRGNAPRTLPMVRGGYILAFVLNELSAILGVIVYFVAAWPSVWVFFALSALGLILNFPARDDFEGVA